MVHPWSCRPASRMSLLNGWDPTDYQGLPSGQRFATHNTHNVIASLFNRSVSVLGLNPASIESTRVLLDPELFMSELPDT
jgi:hypothetical protein